MKLLNYYKHSIFYYFKTDVYFLLEDIKVLENLEKSSVNYNLIFHALLIHSKVVHYSIPTSNENNVLLSSGYDSLIFLSYYKLKRKFRLRHAKHSTFVFLQWNTSKRNLVLYMQQCVTLNTEIIIFENTNAANSLYLWKSLKYFSCSLFLYLNTKYRYT